MKITFLFLFFAVLVNSAKSQTYTVSQIPYNPLPFDTGISVVTSTDDRYGDSVGIGFDFYYFGIPYQQLVVGTNGVLTFDMSRANTYCTWQISGPIPNANLESHIMFTNEDLDPFLGGTIKHQIYGTLPNRKFVVAFNSVPMFNSTSSISNCFGTIPYTGEVILCEGSNNIEVHIHNKDACTDWNQGLAIEGIQDTSRTIAYIVPGRNATVWRDTNDAWLFAPVGFPMPPTCRISGRVVADLDTNCVFSGNDYPLRNRPVIFQNNGTGAQFYSYTDMLGYYSKLVDTGSYTFTTTNIATQFYGAECPVSGNFNVYLPNPYDTSDNNLFADTISQHCSATTSGLWVSGDNYYYYSAFNSCDTGYVYISCTNAGVMNDSVTMRLTLNDSTQILNSPVPYISAGNNVYLFNIGYVYPQNDFLFSVMVHIGCDTIGTPYCFSLEALDTFSTQCPGYTNADTIWTYIGVPLDPNSLYVSSFTHANLGSVQYLQTENDDHFDYSVTFQNTGTAAAHNVKIRVPLSNKINEYTIAPSIASRSYSWLILNDTLIVDFVNINLPDSGTNQAGSHGYFKFQVQQVAGNVAGDSIIERAAIYFDYNSPVITNNAIVKIIDSTTTAIKNINELSAILFPNPSHTQVEVIASGYSEIKVNDVMARTLLSRKLNETKTFLDVSQWTKGVYFVTLSSEKERSTVKFIKD